jgi:hypothetical protein
VISILRASHELAVSPIDRGLGGGIRQSSRAAVRSGCPCGAGFHRIAKAKGIRLKGRKLKYWHAETWQNGDLKRFTKDAVERTGRSERTFQRDSAHRKDRRTDRSTGHVAGHAVRTGQLGEASQAGATRSHRARQGRRKITPSTPPKRLDKNTRARTISGSDESGIPDAVRVTLWVLYADPQT